MAIVTVNWLQRSGGYWAQLCRYAVSPDKTSAYTAWMHDFHSGRVWLQDRPERPDPRALHYVSAAGLQDVDDAPAAFRETWADLPPRVAALHIVQSFSPADELDAETAHRIGRELVRMSFPGAQAVIGTHLDRPHLHNHIIVNNILPETGRHVSSVLPEGTYSVQHASNFLCDSFGLARQDRVDRQREDLWVHVNRTALEKDLAYVRTQTADPEQMLEMLGSFGHKVERTADAVWLQPEGAERRIRLPDLARLQPLPARRRQYTFRNLNGLRLQEEADRCSPLAQQVVQYLHLLGSQRTARRSDITFREYKKIYLVMDALHCITENGLRSKEELRDYSRRLQEEYEKTRTELSAKEARCRELHRLFRSACVAAFPAYALPEDLRAARQCLAAGPDPEDVREERRELEAELVERGFEQGRRRKELECLRTFGGLEPRMLRTLMAEAERRRQRLIESERRLQLSAEEQTLPSGSQQGWWDLDR